MTNKIKKQIRESVALELVEGNLFERLMATVSSTLGYSPSEYMPDEEIEYIKKEARKIMAGAFDRAEKSAQYNDCSGVES